MPQQLIPWTAGLNRATGTPSQAPQGFNELVNAMLLDATLRLRPAIGAPSVSIPDVDVVCFVGVFEAASLTIYVTFTESSRSVDVYTADLQGNAPTLLGNWGTLDTTATTPPLFSMAESFSIVLLAHDEEAVAHRLTTQVFDPTAMTELSPLQQDLVNQPPVTETDVKFRWVANHYTYILGGCFGNASLEGRGEIVRFSHPDDPRLWDATDYVLVGARDVPVVGGRSVPTGTVSGTSAPTGTGTAVFVVGKPGQLWTIQGQDRTTWAPELLDAETGCANHRAMAFMEGLLYVWSSTGPYVTDGVSVTAAGLELDLPNAYPADLPTIGPPHNIWALPLPDERHLVFFVPDPAKPTMLGYVLSARTPQTRRWGLWVAPTAVHGAVVSQGFAFSDAPPGEADPVTTSGSAGSGTAQITTVITPINAVGDEVIELWYKPSAGMWALAMDYTIDTTNPTQTLDLTAGVVVGAYTVAVRMKRQGRYHTGYSGSDPTTWPSYSRATGTVVEVAVPTAVTVVYDYTTGHVTVSWTAGDITEDQDVEIAVVNGVASDTASVTAGTFTKVFATSASGADARSFGSAISAKVRHKIGPVVGSYVSAPTPAPAYWTGSDITGLAFTVTADRESVSLGTDISVQFTKPASVSGDWDFELDIGSFGAYPANGGCSPTTPAGGGYAFPVTFAITPMLTATYPSSQTSPVNVLHVPASPCATCNIAGQIVGFGAYACFWTFAKAGTLTHRTANPLFVSSPFTGYLPGNSAGFSPGLVCGV